MEETVDNSVYGVDVVGSWVEAGMMLVAIAAGVLFAYQIVNKLMSGSRKKNAQKREMANASPWSENMNFSATHNRIHEVLTELRVKLDCARVQIHRFHNGGHFCDLTPMKKSSITHESVNNGITTEGHFKKDLNISLFMPLLDQVKADASIIFKTGDHPDSYHKSVLESSNVIGYVVLPIYGEMGCIGYLMCQWCSWSKFDAVDDVTATELASSIRDQLNALLTLGVPNDG